MFARLRLLNTVIHKSGFKNSNINQSEVLTRKIEEKTGILQFEYKNGLNIMDMKLIEELQKSLTLFDHNDSISAIVITGNKNFSVGGDLKHMANLTFPDVYMEDFLDCWNFMEKCNKPIIAAVNGYAIGAGCILALLSDIIIAGENAKFLVPEILYGLGGGTAYQRLGKQMTKSVTMELALMGGVLSAERAFKLKMISGLYKPEDTLNEARKIAEKIGLNSKPVVSMAKSCVNFGFDLGLKEGLSFEKKLFWSTFALKDREEGVLSFIEKRKPQFKNC